MVLGKELGMVEGMVCILVLDSMVLEGKALDSMGLCRSSRKRALQQLRLKPIVSSRVS